jgi:hypothetical protein
MMIKGIVLGILLLSAGIPFILSCSDEETATYSEHSRRSLRSRRR